MSPKLEEIFRELGISQYLDVFLDQGFDTWETILDITESDLDALGVKLGHRRKLQRRIANARGIAPDVSLTSPTRPSIEDTRPEGHRPDAPLTSRENRDGANAVMLKRKYRRHPKPDENAPERPPSAYVLFSNKMREDLKGQNLTFTEIAKLVGENWQSLTQAEKEPFETQAQNAKGKYNQSLAEYKKTAEYRKYLQYLQDFKTKHANQSQEKEASKRMRLSGSTTGESSPQSNHVGRGGRARSTSDAGADCVPSRRHRIGSTVSISDSQHSASAIAASQLTPGEDCAMVSPRASYFDRRAEHSPAYGDSPRNPQPLGNHPSRREAAAADGARHNSTGPPRHLPPLSDVFDGLPQATGLASSSEPPSFSVLPPGHQTASPAPTPSASGCESRPPSLWKEHSTGGSVSSGSSYSSYPRTPVEGPLPIHALLAGGKPMAPYDVSLAASKALQGRSISPDDRGPPFPYISERSPSDPTTSAAYPVSHLNVHHSGPPPVSGHPSNPLPPRSSFPGVLVDNRPTHAPVRRTGSKADAWDGISALLQADKLVDRRTS